MMIMDVISFNIDGLGNDIQDAAIQKTRVDKHCKVYGQLKSLIGAMTNPRYRLTTDDDEIIKYVHCHRNELDDEVNGLLESNPVIDELYPESQLRSIINKIDAFGYGNIFSNPDRSRIRHVDDIGYDLDEIDFITHMLSGITTKDHPLYAFHKCRTMPEIRKIVLSMPIDANLNWIDVSGIRNMSFLFGNLDFTGDISLWDMSDAEMLDGFFYNGNAKVNISDWNVSKARSMTYMFFNNGAFFGDLTRWRINAECNTNGMFESSIMTNNLKPERVR